MRKPQPKPPPPEGFIQLYKVPVGGFVELSDGKVVKVLGQEGIFTYITPDGSRVDSLQLVKEKENNDGTMCKL